MKKILILMLMLSFFIISCGKKDEVKKEEGKKDQKVIENVTPEAFFKAIDSGKVDVIKAMLEKDKSLLTVKRADDGYRSGFSALYLAVSIADFVPTAKEIVDLLLKNGADVNMSDEFGSTPLHTACSGGNHSDATTKVVEFLLDNKANINAVNNSGETPIYVAVHWDNENIVKLLKSRGADLSIKTKKGKTPMDEAKEKKIESLINILK